MLNNFLAALFEATRNGNIEWEKSSNKEVYATTSQCKSLMFLGQPVEVSVIFDIPSDTRNSEFEPIVRVTRPMPCNCGAYYQELFRVSDKDGVKYLIRLIHEAYKKEIEQSLMKLVPDAEPVASPDLGKEALDDLTDQLGKLQLP